MAITRSQQAGDSKAGKHLIKVCQPFDIQY